MHFPSLALAAALPARPTQGMVYALDPTLGPTPEAVGQVWGVTASPTVGDNEVMIGDIQYYPSSGAIFYDRQSVRVPGPGDFPHAITGGQDAIVMAHDYLVSHGLFRSDEIPIADATAAPSDISGGPGWSIQMARSLGGVPERGGLTAGARLLVTDTGRIDGVVVGHRTIAGSQPAGLIDAAEAWRQVTLGHWYSNDGVLDTSRPTRQPPFVADTVELCYHEQDGFTSQHWFVPFWCFADTRTAPDFTVRLTSVSYTHLTLPTKA